MTHFALDGAVRDEIIRDLVVAQTILARAEKKYGSQSSGGLGRALACVRMCLRRLDLNDEELLQELEEKLGNRGIRTHGDEQRDKALLRRLRVRLNLKLTEEEDGVLEP